MHLAQLFFVIALRNNFVVPLLISESLQLYTAVHFQDSWNTCWRNVTVDLGDRKMPAPTALLRRPEELVEAANVPLPAESMFNITVVQRLY